MPANTVSLLLQYIWVPIVSALVWLSGRATSLDSRAALLEQSHEHHELQRLEDRKLRDCQRAEDHARFDNHHRTVIKKLDSLETRVKNGH